MLHLVFGCTAKCTLRYPDSLNTAAAKHQLRPERTTTTSSARPGLRTTSSGLLPVEILEKAVNRLGWLALVYASTWVILHFVYRGTNTSPQLLKYLPFQMLFTAIGVPLGGAVCALAWSKKLPASLMVDIGLLFEVLGALVISLAENIYPLETNVLIRGHSAIAIWVVFFCLVVPTSFGKALLAAFATACMGPLGMAINIVAMGAPNPTPGQWVVLYITPFLMAFASVALSRYVYDLGANVNRQRDLGSYELIEPIGQGGMGEVWRARHRLLVRDAAIKLIRPEALVGDSPEEIAAARKRFEREAQATAGLHSPHTVAIHDYGIAEDGSFYYVMELLDGLDLEAFVDRFGPVPAPRVTSILRQVCDSLAEAHAAGLTHRDIKPRNIFLCRLGVNFDFVKVLDFGLVKMKGATDQSLTRDGVATGTPAYMSPEMALGHYEVDARTDLYALGCVAYWLLTGHLVFEAPNALSMALEHVQSKPIPPSQRTELDIPPALESLILQCLEKDPAHRPQTARQLARALDAVGQTGSWTQDQAEEWWHINMPASQQTITTRR